MAKARKLCDVFRFIDGLNAINDAGIFESNFRDVYPEELELRRKDGNNATFLGRDIKIKNNKFQKGLFNKRNSFPSSIVRMPEKFSTIPPNIFYMSTGAECLRIASFH